MNVIKSSLAIVILILLFSLSSFALEKEKKVKNNVSEINIVGTIFKGADYPFSNLHVCLSQQGKVMSISNTGVIKMNCAEVDERGKFKLTFDRDILTHDGFSLALRYQDKDMIWKFSKSTIEDDNGVPIYIKVNDNVSSFDIGTINVK